jgi:hypothetical protein
MMKSPPRNAVAMDLRYGGGVAPGGKVFVPSSAASSG